MDCRKMHGMNYTKFLFLITTFACLNFQNYSFGPRIDPDLSFSKCILEYTRDNIKDANFAPNHIYLVQNEARTL